MGRVSDTVNVVSLGALSASGKTPVTGSFAATGQSAAFTPIAGRDFNIAMSGTFVATVQLEQSFDGTNWLAIKVDDTQLCVFTSTGVRSWANSESGVQFRLNCTAYSSGTVTYRVSQ